jgi:hypothetical protein
LREIDHPPEHSDRFSVVIFKVEKIITEWPPTIDFQVFSQLIHRTALQVHEKLMNKNPFFLHCQLHYVTRAD